MNILTLEILSVSTLIVIFHINGMPSLIDPKVVLLNMV